VEEEEVEEEDRDDDDDDDFINTEFHNQKSRLVNSSATKAHSIISHQPLL
jgi:hypothetical protein